MILGPIGVDEVISCNRRFELERWKRRFDSCSCIAHEFARHWWAITGDSWIVHGTPVYGAEGAASYMAKYLTKGFLREDREEQLGMVRRWSSSRGWPGSSNLHLRQTDEGGWEERLFRPGRVEERFVGGPEDLMERVGDNLTLARSKKNVDRRNIKEMERMLTV